MSGPNLGFFDPAVGPDGTVNAIYPATPEAKVFWTRKTEELEALPDTTDSLNRVRAAQNDLARFMAWTDTNPSVWLPPFGIAAGLKLLPGSWDTRGSINSRFIELRNRIMRVTGSTGSGNPVTRQRDASPVAAAGQGFQEGLGEGVASLTETFNKLEPWAKVGVAVLATIAVAQLLNAVRG